MADQISEILLMEFPSSQLGDGAGLLIQEAWFEPKEGSIGNPGWINSNV